MGIKGWIQVVQEHYECVDPEDEDDDGECLSDDIICLGFDEYDDAAVRRACAEAGPEIHLITAGEGWPWLSRVIQPVTLVTLT